MRQATYDEEALVTGFFEAAQAGLSRKVLQGRDLAILDHADGRKVVLADPAVWNLPEGLWADADGGLLIGEIGDDAFHLDLQGAVRMAAATTQQCVRVLEKASHLFLYGKKILAVSIDDYDRSLRRGDACIVTGPRGEALGIGVVIGNLKGQGEAVEPLHDLGEYLRGQ